MAGSSKRDLAVVVEPLLTLGSAGFVVLATFVAEQHERIKAYGTPVVFALFLAHIVVGAARSYLLWRRWFVTRIPGLKVKVPSAGYNGDSRLSNLLSTLHSKLHSKYLAQSDDKAVRLRATIFVPFDEQMSLVQVARCVGDWNTRHCVSGTRIRMGTCTVGHAYTEKQTYVLPTVDVDGGFLAALNKCGLTDDEVEQQVSKDCVFFSAHPLIDTSGKVRAVVAIDAAVANAVPADWIYILHDELADNMIRTMFGHDVKLQAPPQKPEMVLLLPEPLVASTTPTPTPSNPDERSKIKKSRARNPIGKGTAKPR